jgi:CAAX prenyl protease-like protein
MLAYILPFALFLGLTQLAAAFPEHYAWLYPAMVLGITAVTVPLVSGQRLLRPHFRVLPGVVVCLVGIVLWIGLCQLNLEATLIALLPDELRPDPRPGFNPFDRIAEPAARWGFIAMRLLGLAVLVPIAEELFWRGFLLRWLSDPNWKERQVGDFTWQAFVLVVLLFTLAHPEWLAAAVYCTLLNGLLYWTRDLWNCVVAHAVTNLLLGIYVLTTGAWQLW